MPYACCFQPGLGQTRKGMYLGRYVYEAWWWLVVHVGMTAAEHGLLAAQTRHKNSVLQAPAPQQLLYLPPSAL